MVCKLCGKPLGEAVRMGAIKHVCVKPIVEAPKPRRRTPKPKQRPVDKPEE